MGALAERHKWFGMGPEPPPGETVKLSITDHLHKPALLQESEYEDVYLHVVFLNVDTKQYPIHQELPDGRSELLMKAQLKEWSKVRPDTVVFTYPSRVKGDPQRAFELLMLDSGVFRGETAWARGGGDRSVNALDYVSVKQKQNQPTRYKITYTKQSSLVEKSYLWTPQHHHH